MKRIAFIGMPGCGKTTIGRIIAEKLGFRFVDCDEYLETSEGMTISKMFKDFGEDYFRQKETAVLGEVTKWDNVIISTGGGVVERQENLKLLSNCDAVVFINRSIENILKDIDTEKRPLLKQKKDNLYRLYQNRIEHYKTACSVEVENNSSVDAVVSKILSEVTKNG